uniref:Uncharacterized protein n=1 Tax=Caenorhabditis japonica TaxID=281687 RepID=A0A8R1HK54_CAEJA
MLNLTRGQFGTMKSLFREFGIVDPFPSRNQIGRIEGEYGDESFFEVVAMLSTDSEGNEKEVTVCRLKDVAQYVQLRVQELAFREKLLFNDTTKF